jgi:hypothetical protein
LLSCKFQQVEDAVIEGEPFDVLQDPARIFTGDESSFQIFQKTGKFLACKGDRNVHEADRTLAKESITAHSHSLILE